MKKIISLIAACLFSILPVKPQSVWFGTGFAIGGRYVVTNYHVVEDAKSIFVKVERNNINRDYYAEVVATDKVNDIAVIKITDSDFKSFGAIPYGVTTRVADVGEDVFVLGYPLGSILGDEIKLTTGVINSRTGMIGFENCYQIQAPITNGNSGGPMFDNKGNVIGIVVGGLNKELNLAENVGFAIKTAYLKIMIDNAGLTIPFPNNNTIANLSRPEKVKRIKKFVCYIECDDTPITKQVPIQQQPTTPQTKPQIPKETPTKPSEKPTQLPRDPSPQPKIIAEGYVDLGLPSGTLWCINNESGYFSYDEAVTRFGKHLPSREMWIELKDKCNWKWTDKGYTVTGPNGNSIFLPAAGGRGGMEVGTYGCYWSSTCTSEDYAWAMYFFGNDLYGFSYGHYYGLSVRLVKD
ncbi:MAG: trypsin-like peptidase domain-containing protein [Bacteroidales bacterium]|nr:trypsin-like peptidase domain-containing protein [Bacteroidales bacterium]